MTSSDIEARLTAARADQKKCKKYSAELQMEYRHHLAKAKEEEDNIPATTHIKNLTRQEETRALFRRIRYMERKVTNLSMSRVTISRAEGTPHEITNQYQMENVIIHTNEKKYQQTKGCGQLQKGELLQDIGTMGTGPKTCKILDGTYRIPSGTTAIT